ncbi:L-threonylcarbamoyladenylate synthase [Leuconostoc fallax]|uniref:L-threonylcarbamoyladenylate synthase n=1 Tax=Leuconostoc fallax TaxID=1251 RepID=UPI0020904D77|nr:L-threonylcarbamoyladenylate synthase [Leuconostoc fallax]MCO6183329.1 L-threonylcarbamoyladenylate synthase [Leuconostoc fallax]
MNTQRLGTSEQDILFAGKLLSQGEVVAFPTETVYGLGAVATDEVAVRKVFTAKGRPSDNPLIVTVADKAMVQQFAVENDMSQKLMAAFWPGSLTIILPMRAQAFSMTVTGGLNTVAFRLPDNEVARAVIRAAKAPIVGPSANTSGKPSPTTAQHVWHDMAGKIAAIVDDGPTTVGVESTVIDVSGNVPTILRPGAITQEQLVAVLAQPVHDATTTESVASDVTPKAPGMKYRHYAPDKHVVMFDELDAVDLAQKLQDNDVVMAQDRILQAMAIKSQQAWSLGDSLESATEQLFSGLRFYDDQPKVGTIYVQKMIPVGLGKAYNNRLAKAAGNQEFNI